MPKSDGTGTLNIGVRLTEQGIQFKEFLEGK